MNSNRTGNGSTTLRRYTVRNPAGEWIGIFVISDDGYFSTVSDFGSYAHYWSNAGPCFRTALARLTPDYLLGKLSRRDWYDGEATARAVRRHIKEYRRERHITALFAREEWDLVEVCDSLDSRESFTRWYDETKINDASEFAEYDYPPQARAFGEKAWPHFVAVLRAELAAERASSATISPPALDSAEASER